MKENEPRYIQESREYIVNGRVVKESSLTEAEKRKVS